MINTLPILEAKDSSEIENIVTTTDKLFQYADSNEAHADPATKEALRYRRALYEGWQTLAQRPINTNMAESICSQIKGVSSGCMTDVTNSSMSRMRPGTF